MSMWGFCSRAPITKRARTIRPGLRVRVLAFHGVQHRVTLNNEGAVLA